MRQSSVTALGAMALVLLAGPAENFVRLPSGRMVGSASGRPLLLLEDLLTVIEYDLGYELYRAVSATKIALSSQDETRLSFNQMGVEIDRAVTRADFDGWIAEDVAAIMQWSA